MMRRSLRLTMVAAAIAAAACQSENAPVSEPAAPEIARVTVTPANVSVEAGSTTRLDARVEDTSGQPVNATIEWFSYDASVATVGADGLVTGVAPGAATITASVDGKRGSARVTVTDAPGTVLIQSITPNPLIEGQTATITGRGFGFVTSNLKVTIDGVTASITASSPTSLQVIVPQADCRPARTVDVQVRMLASPSNIVKQPLRPPQFLDIPIGRQLLLRSPSEFCMQFAASGASEAYLIGVQSISETITQVTPATLTSVAAVAGTSPDGSVLPLYSAVPVIDPFVAGRGTEAQLQRGRAVPARVHMLEREFLQGFGSGHVISANRASVPSLPSALRVGDVVTIRVPAFTDQCNRFATISAVVRLVAGRSLWLEDTGNPAGGYTAADFEALSAFFENTVYDTDVGYLGQPSDQDRNGRVAILVTKEVNRLSYEYDPLFDLAGVVKGVNWVPSCPASNEGEYIYLRTSDVAGQFGRPTPSAAGEIPSAKLLLAHEFAHVIQFSHQAPGNARGSAFQPNWISEGQATFAEEVVGHRLNGNAPGRNYGYATGYGSNQNVRWYRGLSGLSYYYGFLSATQRAAGAPEQCGWIGLASEGNNGPCASNDIVTYDLAWAFLRWISDQYGPRVAGGEKAIQQGLVDNPAVGFGAIAGITHTPIDSLLARFAAALWVDDRVPGIDPGLTFTSWNMFDIDEAKVESARLVPRERAFTGFSDSFTVRASSTAYFRVSGAGRTATAIRVRSPSGSLLPASMRVWLVRVR